MNDLSIDPTAQRMLTRTQRDLCRTLAMSMPLPLREAKPLLERDLAAALARGSSIGEWMQTVKARLTRPS